MLKLFNKPPTEYKVIDVFTPTKPARYTFVERATINDKLVAALRTPGKQIVVYGYTGSGKTTLLANKLHQLYEDHITSRCVTGLKFDQLVLDAFDQLGGFYGAARVETQKRSISPTLEAEYLGIKAKLGADSSEDQQITHQRILPPQLTPQALARFLGEAKCCWVLEDFHKIDPGEKRKLAQVMKVFMDMADHYNELKIIAIGAVDTARQVVEHDAEMSNRVSEIYVSLMTDEEIREIPEKGERLLNFRLSDDVKNDLVKSSNGLASVCHQLCLNMCFAANINVTLKKPVLLGGTVLKKAIEQYLAEASDTLKGAFDKAFRQEHKSKYEDAKLIVEALLQVDQDGAGKATLLEKIHELNAGYPAQRLTANIEHLQNDTRGMIIRYDPSSGRYSFKDPFYRAFALAYTRKDRKDEEKHIEFVTSDFDRTIVKLLDFWWEDSERPQAQNFKQHNQQQNKKAHQMDWDSRVFTQRRNFKGRKR